MIAAGGDGGSAVYFVQAVGANLVKIGWVRNAGRIDRRVARMATDCPYPVKLLHLHRGAERAAESRVHRVFSAVHHHGEWFRIEDELKAFLQLCALDSDAARDVLSLVIENRGLTLPMSFA